MPNTLEPLLGDTFGVFLYQEQVLRVAHDLAGLSLAEADLRTAQLSGALYDSRTTWPDGVDPVECGAVAVMGG